jgi:hypothetical protein
VSIVTRLHCDGCHRELDWFEGFRREHPPVGWFYAMWNQGEDGDDLHACSWTCFIAAIDRRRPVQAHLVPAPPLVTS